VVVFNLQNIWIRRLISISFILIVAIIGHFLAILTWKMIVKPTYSYSSMIELPKQVAQVNNNISDSTKASRIANIHMFGQFKEKRAEPVEVVKPTVAPKATPLKFVLMATAVNVNVKKGLASIADGADVHWFRVGDDVFEKATLYAVYDDKVEFERDNGDIEVLEFKEDKLIDYKDYIAPERGQNLGSEFDYKERTTTSKNYSRNIGSNTNTTSPTTSSQTSNTSNTSRNQLPEIVTTIEEQEANVKKVQEAINTDSKVRSQVERYVTNQINKAKSNPVSTLTQYGLKYIQGKGYQVTSRARDLMLLGLRSGDIITSINGNRATTPTQDIKLIDQVMSSGEILIEYERNGKVLVMKQALLQF